MRRLVKLAALRTHEEAKESQESQESPSTSLSGPMWRPPPGLELEMPLPPCPPPPLPPNLQSLQSLGARHGAESQGLHLWSQENDREGSAELKAHPERITGIVLQPIERPFGQLEDPIDAPISSLEQSPEKWSLKPMTRSAVKPVSMLGRSLDQVIRQPLNLLSEKTLDKLEDAGEGAVKPTSNERTFVTSTLRLPALHGCVICGSRSTCSCPRVHSEVAPERFPSQDLDAIQAHAPVHLSVLVTAGSRCRFGLHA